jgi:hypothetical protein
MLYVEQSNGSSPSFACFHCLKLSMTTPYMTLIPRRIDHKQEQDCTLGGLPSVIVNPLMDCRKPLKVVMIKQKQC